MEKNKTIVFILAGGSGTRLAPLSLSSPGKLPKQFLSLISEKTMLEETIARVPQELKKVIIGEEKYENEIRKQADFEGNAQSCSVLSEPFPCNTAMAIGLGAIYAKYLTNNEDVVIYFKPSDHHMHLPSFQKYFAVATKKAHEGKIITIGITPDRPETGLGYIKTKELVDNLDNVEIYQIDCFVEKPNLEKATEYVESGQYFWNSGMFCFTIKTILDKLEKHAPIIFESLKRIEGSFGKDNQKETIKKEYENVKSQKANISIDFAVMEKESENILMVKAGMELEWDDIGLWIAVEKYFPKDDNGNIKRGEAEFKNCKNVTVFNYKKDQKVSVSDLEEIMVINSENGVLICPRLSSIRAKDMVDPLSENQKEILIDSQNIKMDNETELPVACIECENLKIDITDQKLKITKR